MKHFEVTFSVSGVNDIIKNNVHGELSEIKPLMYTIAEMIMKASPYDNNDIVEAFYINNDNTITFQFTFKYGAGFVNVKCLG